MQALKLVSNDPYQARLDTMFSDLSHWSKDDCWGNELHVTFSIDSKEWKMLSTKGNLGMLYGVDLSNYLSRAGILNEYSVPSVDDKSRAKNGRKTIRIRYTLKGGK